MDGSVICGRAEAPGHIDSPGVQHSPTAEILPQHKDVPFSLVNRLVKKKEIGEIIDIIYRHCGQKETVMFVDRLMSLGFQNACKAGISFGKDDLIVPEAKKELVAETEKQVKEFEQQYQNGLITKGEKYNKVIDIWAACTDKVADEMMKNIYKPVTVRLKISGISCIVFTSRRLQTRYR